MYIPLQTMEPRSRQPWIDMGFLVSDCHVFDQSDHYIIMVFVILCNFVILCCQVWRLITDCR